MLWRGAVLLREAKKADGLDAHLVSAVALDLQAQEITLEFEHRLLRSRWCVAKSRRLLDAARDLENIAKQPDSA